MSTFEQVKSTLDQAEQIAHKTFLATLGFYGKSWEFITAKLDTSLEQANSTFNQFVADGEKYQSAISEKLKGNQVLDEKFSEIKTKLGLDEQQKQQQLAQLNDKIEALTAAVNKIAEQKANEKTATSAPVKEPVTTTVAKKTTAKRKPAATKSSASKTAATRKKPAPKPAN